MAKTKVKTIPPYDLVISPIGYFNKREITNQDLRALVKGSKNMIINDADKAVGRKGFVLDGVAGTVKTGIKSNYDFLSRNGKKPLRAYLGTTINTGKLQVRTEYVAGTPIWYDLLTTLTYADFCFTTWWDATESVRVLIFVDGTTSIRMWGGGVAYISSNNATTLTKAGTETWAQAGFFINLAGRTVTIPGYGTFAYTGGETTTTLTGLSGLPAITVGTPAFQGVVTVTSLTGVSPAITPDVVMTKDNQIWYEYTKSSVIWGSKNTDYKDCSFSTPIRVPGEGFKITLDNFVVGSTQGNSDSDADTVYVFAGLDDLYKIIFTLNSAQDGESITFSKKSATSQAAISRKAIIPVKNGIMYFTNEKNLTWLTSVPNIFTPQSLPTSDPIKDDFDSYNLTGTTGIFFENALWVTIPRENLVYIYDFDKALWHTPQTIPVSGFSIIKNETTQKNELYGHSNSANETYRLNVGLDDNGVKIQFVAAFAYRQFGDRSKYKQFDEYYFEAYMSTVTKITAQHLFEYLGSEVIIEKEIDGADTGLMFATLKDSSLGKDNLGKNPLGSTSDIITDLNKYRVIWEIKAIDFFEHQVIFSSDVENAQFEILAHGPNVEMSTNIPRSIKR
jgi:hypothetical protein